MPSSVDPKRALDQESASVASKSTEDDDSFKSPSVDGKGSSRWKLFFLFFLFLVAGGVVAAAVFLVGIFTTGGNEGITKDTWIPDDGTQVNGDTCIDEFDSTRYDTSLYETPSSHLAGMNATSHSECDCKDLCLDHGYNVAHFVPTWAYVDMDNCRCFASEELDCLLPYPEDPNVYPDFFWGSIFVNWGESPFPICDYDICDVDPYHRKCWRENKGWLIDFDDVTVPEPVLKSHHTSSYSCWQSCQDQAIVLYVPQPSSLEDNCLCYNEEISCYVQFGEPRVFDPPYATIRSRIPLDHCEKEWCDIFPEDPVCYNLYHYEIEQQHRYENEEEGSQPNTGGSMVMDVFGPMGHVGQTTATIEQRGWPWQPSTGDYLNPNDQANVATGQDCVAHCLPHHQVAVHLTSTRPTDFDSNCLCYSDEDSPMCALPWGDQVDSNHKYGFAPMGKVYTRDETPMEDCSDGTWCDVVPDHWLCHTSQNYLLHGYGWPAHIEGDLLEASEQVNVASAKACVEHCQSYSIATYVNSPTDLSNENCLCYEEQEMCIVPWGVDVDFRLAPTGRMFSLNGEALDYCENDLDWCDVKPDHWLCHTN